MGIKTHTKRKTPRPKGKGKTPKPPMSKKTTTLPLLVEVGTEELPWQVIQPAFTHLARAIQKVLTDKRISFGAVRSMGTPRRLAVLVDEVSRKQESSRREILGPPKSAAFDAQGSPTPAAQGFAKSQGVLVKDLQIQDTAKGAYVCVVKEEKGRLAGDVLKESLPGIIEKLSFPKSMRWNDTGIRFARPIRWMVVLLGQTTVKFSVGGIVSGNTTCGHRFLKGKRGKRATISSPAQYVNTLRRVGVWVDPDERTAILKTRLSSLAKSVKGHPFPEHADSLLEQAVYSLECPHAVLGQFDSLYLHLPQEVLITSMKEHQGFFAIAGAQGQLLSRFIAPTNMKLTNMTLIRKGNERVLSARLADAQYFFNEDRKRKLADRLDDLNGVIFHKKLGTLYQKSERMVALAPFFAGASGDVQDKECCQRAALLSKADLTTGMVGEFPTLQGIMGREYARHDGEAESVCQALSEQYLPRNPDDPIPASELGQRLSLIDRIDTLAAFFRAGVIPSGSEDPLGLRRQAFGLIRILVEGTVDINICSVLRQARAQLDAHGVRGKHDAQAPSEEDALLTFLAERVRFYGRTQHGFREDVMDVILDRPTPDSFHVRDVFLRMEALQAMTAEVDFEPLIIGFKRANRLVDKEQWTSSQVDSAIFEDSAEGELFFAVDKARNALSSLMTQRDYRGVLLTLLGLKPAIDQFFTAVLVNAPDAKVRANRLSLLSVVKHVFLEFGDFSKIQVQSNS